MSKRLILLTMLMLVAFVAAACGGTAAVTPTEEAPMATEEPMVETPAEASIAEIAAGDPNFSTLVAALSAAGLVDTLAGEGQFTVFAPTNDAFAALPAGTVDALLADPTGDLTQILLYHVVDGVALASDVVGLDSVTTLQGEPISIEVVDGGVVLNGTVNVTTTDIMASNGVIHVIDAVLLPPADEAMAPDMSIAEIAAADPNFSTLVAALSAAGLVDTLAGEGNFTVFAPTNDAFAALPEGTVDTLLADPTGDLTQILLYHVVDGVALAEDVVGMDSATTLNGAPISIAVVDGGVVLNDSVRVTATDIMATNGVIHVIDAVLLPPADDEMMAPDMSIAEIAAGDENFSTLVAALSAAGLVDTLAGEGNFTVFAPTNDAFAALPEGTVDTLLADPTGDLTQILLYHVVDGAAKAADVVGLDSVTTLNGAPISIEVVADGVVLNGTVNVTATDIMATNGVIHVIDAVLLPPAEAAMTEDMSIAEIVAGNADFSTLLAALQAAGLDATLAAEGEYTVFAPTNEAFAALPAGTLDTLLADPTGDLTQILLYHVLQGVATADDVVSLTSAQALQGSPITIEVTDEGVVLNGSVLVTQTDIVANNGVIHVINGVLLPPAQ
jgi:uncharacterized surface protein with fasciclin (FAS1) repeats